MPMTNDRRRLIEYVLIVTMLCGTAATASGQGASAETGRTGPAGAGAPAAVVGAPGAAEAVGDPGAVTDPEAGKPEEAETAELEQEADIAELERRIDVLAEEIERLRSGEDDERLDIDEARRLGLAPSAAAAYAIDRGVSIAGYGEMLLENYADVSQGGSPTGKTTQFDYLRAILYAATGSTTGSCSTPRSRSSTPRRSSSSSRTSTTRRPTTSVCGAACCWCRWGW